jgi:DNA gyrase/topoisomerase IV subunit A
MREWKRLFRKEGYAQVEKNKFHNKENGETIVFNNGLILAYKNEKQVPLRQNLLPACVSFVDEHIYVRKTRKLVGFLCKDDYLTIVEHSEVPYIHRIEQPQKSLKMEILSAKFFTDEDKILIADASGKMHALDPTNYESGDVIELKEVIHNFVAPATYLGKLDSEGAAKDFFVIVTEKNKVKKTMLSEFNEFKSSITAIDLRGSDKIIFAAPANDGDDLILLSSDNKALRLAVFEFPAVERIARGYKAFDSQKDVMDAILVAPDSDVLSLSGGKGKLTKAEHYPFGGRSSNGRIIATDTTRLLTVEEEVLVLDEQHRFALIKKDEIPHKQIRSTGVKIIAEDTHNIFG